MRARPCAKDAYACPKDIVFNRLDFHISDFRKKRAERSEQGYFSLRLL